MIDALARDGIAYVPFFPLGALHRCNPLRCRMLLRAWVQPHAGGAGVAVTTFTEYFADPGTSSVAHLRENMAAEKLHLSRKCCLRWMVFRENNEYTKGKMHFPFVSFLMAWSAYV